MKLQHPEVRYEVTDLCNSHCIMCPREKHDRAHGIMDQSKYEASIDEIVRLGATQVVLTGFGEPLLDKRLEDKIKYAKSKGLRTYIITNASAITKNRAMRLIYAGLDEMRVSFYGMKKQSYELVMQGLEYQRTVDNILGFIALRDALKSKTKIQISYIVLPENEQDTQAFQDYWEPKVDFIEIWKPHNFGDGKDYRDRTAKKVTCGRPRNGPLQIQWNGEVIPCCYDYNNQIILGNAFEQSISSILKGSRYEKLRIQHDTGDFPHYCDQCDQLLEHSDALVYSNRHDLSSADAVKLSNTDLYNLSEGKSFDE